MRICIDPGHGQHDPGAVGLSGLYEKNVALNVALKLGKILQDGGYDVVYTRTNDQPGFPVNQTENLRRRVHIANTAQANLFVSVHCNSVCDRTAHGTETFVVGKGGQAERLADCIQVELIEATGLVNRGVKEANFLVLRETAMPAILVELAFISNPSEERLLRDPAWQDKAAMAIAQGIAKHTGRKLKEGKNVSAEKPAQWKLDIMKDAEQAGLIEKGKHQPDETATKWFVLAVALNLDKIKGGK